MEAISFNYTDSRGHTTDWTVSGWNESGRYIQGVCTVDEQFRTFRKDRINRYLGGSEVAITVPYTPPPPKIETRPQICFTGFQKAQRATLEAFASDNQMLVRKDVTKDLAFLCCGPSAGPSKVSRARDKGCLVIEESGLRTMVETGVLPESWEFEC
ncbi:hypothetical protein [Marinobacter sp. SS13-12]|uniref:hypothetical protein n=1 Tax=Marinobacter sp. SS13-12 TaxID=3050451 RepID=UPI0025554806|nr:hypothetical protein [Marinobacter sp. SS13-12]MDK8463433.1 hypothetical protein [Marinobacter sp. SS13-12]